MPAISESCYMVQAGWDDVPHLDEDTKKELLSGIEPHLKSARTKGTPSLGAGAIYPLDMDEFLVDPFPLPKYWPRCYGLDVGWNRTACVWAAHDKSVDVVYLYTEHYRGQAEPSIHAASIKSRGAWIPGVIDPAAHGRQQKDGDQLIKLYRGLGLKISPAVNAVDSGVWAVWERLSTGRLKAFRTMPNFQAEYRLYRRDKDGKIIKEFDHLMDAMRYLIMSGLAIAVTEPLKAKGLVGATTVGKAGY